MWWLVAWLPLAAAAPPNPYAPTRPVQTESPFAWTVTAPTLAAEAAGELLLGATVPPGALLYRDMVEVEVVDTGGLVVGSPDIPAGVSRPDPAFDGAERAVFDRDVVVRIPVQIPNGWTGESDVRLRVRYQGCRDRLCYPPATEELVARVRPAH